MVLEMIEHVIREEVLPAGAESPGEYLFIAVMVNGPHSEERGKALPDDHDDDMIFEDADRESKYDKHEQRYGCQLQPDALADGLPAVAQGGGMEAPDKHRAIDH